MASCSDILKKLQKKSPREFYFHVQGTQCLKVLSAGTDPAWKDILEEVKTSPDEHYHIVQCAEGTTVEHGRAIRPEDNQGLKHKLKDFIKGLEDYQASLSFRFEARFGRLFFAHESNQLVPSLTSTKELVQDKNFKKAFVTRLHHPNNIGEFIQKNCYRDGGAQPAEITHKIRFMRGGGKYFMYVDEKNGAFTLRSTHECRFNVEKKVDIIRPEGSYDIRVVAGVYEFDEEQVPADVNETAKIIVKSMERCSSLFDPEELRIQLVGTEFHVEYVREKKKKEYNWKPGRWIIVEQDVHQFTLSPENRAIYKRDHQFVPVPLKYDKCHKEIEVWSKVHERPKELWTADELLETNYFDEFVGTCFDIADLLDRLQTSTDSVHQ